jgi:hypothetical protein
MQGWIKLHREIFEKPIWLESTPEQKTILITLLGMANHQEKQWEWSGFTYKLEPGQFITSLESIANKCGKGVSVQNVRTALKRFESHQFLTNKSTNKNRLISIVNWGFYQAVETELTNKLTSNQQATNKQLTTNKNVRKKECKNDIKPSSPKFEIYDMELAELLFKRMQENNPGVKQPNLEKWAEEVRLLRERDQRTVEQIRYLINWSQQDPFWKANILSTSKLRKKWDQLVLKTKEQNSKAKQPVNNKPLSKEDFDLND